MLNKHDPPVIWFYKIEDLLDLLATIAETVFHHLSGNMPLLIGEQHNTGALNIGTLQRLNSP